MFTTNRLCSAKKYSLRASLLLNILPESKQMKTKLVDFMVNQGHLGVLIFTGLLLIAVVIPTNSAQAKDKKAPSREIGVNGFLDEDGDGFNDLLPDSDGDGVPDALDPDFKGHRGDSAGNHQQCPPVLPDSGGPMHDHHGGDMEPHGEPGMFGPGDTTGHHGIHGGDGEGGGRHGGHGPHGGLNPDDSTGGGGDGLNPRDSTGHHKDIPGIIEPPKEIRQNQERSNPEKGVSGNQSNSQSNPGTQKEIRKENTKR
jgi:hypothetical protein